MRTLTYTRPADSVRFSWLFAAWTSFPNLSQDKLLPYRRLTFMMLDAAIVAVSPATVWGDVSYLNVCATFYYLCLRCTGSSFPCLLDPPGRFPFHQMGHPRLPRYLWPLEQVFQPPRFSFGIVSLRRDNSAFTKSFPREHSSPRSSQVIEVVTLFPAYSVAPNAPKFVRPLPQPYLSSPKAARAFVTTATSRLASDLERHSGGRPNAMMPALVVSAGTASYRRQKIGKREKNLVVSGEIACVAVLDRTDVRRKLDEVLP